MKFITFKTGPVSVNTYIIYDEKTLNGFIIDPGGTYKRIVKEASDLGINLKAQLLTHGHFDHCGVSSQLQKDGVPVYVHKDDANKLNSDGNLAGYFGIHFEKFIADHILNDNDIINIAGFDIKVLHTPGHSTGSVCYVLGNNIFSGDTLFRLSIGRTDFPEGDYNKLQNSIKNKLFKLEGDYNVYPGHDISTTLSYEKSHNTMIER